MGLTQDEKRALKGASRVANVLGPGFDSIAAAIPDACHISGLSRREIYRRLATGDIRAVKSGARTLILMDSLRTVWPNCRQQPPSTEKNVAASARRGQVPS